MENFESRSAMEKSAADNEYKLHPKSAEDWERIAGEVRRGTYTKQDGSYGVMISGGNWFRVGKWQDLGKIHDQYDSQLVFSKLEPAEEQEIFALTGWNQLKPFEPDSYDEDNWH